MSAMPMGGGGDGGRGKGQGAIADRGFQQQQPTTNNRQQATSNKVYQSVECRVQTRRNAGFLDPPKWASRLDTDVRLVKIVRFPKFHIMSVSILYDMRHAKQLLAHIHKSTRAYSGTMALRELRVNRAACNLHLV
jgi:hypothetical protein